MNGGRWLRLATLLAYAAFLAYQSLGSGAGWECAGPVLSLDARVSRTDLLANVVAYVPLGLIGVMAAAAGTTDRRRIVVYGALVLAGAAAFSTTMEYLQACQPDRVSSMLDVAANTAGGLLGVLAGLIMEGLALARSRTPDLLVVPSADERATRRLWLITVAVGLVWLASQTLPWTFSADVGSFRANLSFLRRWNGVASLDGWRVLHHAGAWVALACAAHLATWRREQAAITIVALAGVSIGLQVMLSTRAPLSFEEIGGMTLALVVAAPLLFLEDDAARTSAAAPLLWLGAMLTVTGYELRPEPELRVGDGFQWWPGVGIGGMRGALDYAMLFGWCGLATVVAAAHRFSRRHLLTWPAAAIVITLLLEVAQRAVPGRTGDLSAPMFTLLGVLAARVCLGDVRRASGDT